MSDAAQESELGRSKSSTTPADHLLHLLTLGWSPTSPLIIKYVSDNRLTRELNEWQALNPAPVVKKTKAK
jgi:hypothetical protein